MKLNYMSKQATNGFSVDIELSLSGVERLNLMNVLSLSLVAYAFRPVVWLKHVQSSL